MDKNPVELASWPFLLPHEIALKSAPLSEVCESYGISSEEWAVLKDNPAFRRAVQDALELNKKDGHSVKTKSKILAEEFMVDLYRLGKNIPGDVPYSTQLEAIKHTCKIAGYDAENKMPVPGNGFQFVLNMGPPILAPAITAERVD